MATVSGEARVRCAASSFLPHGSRGTDTTLCMYEVRCLQWMLRCRGGFRASPLVSFRMTLALHI